MRRHKEELQREREQGAWAASSSSVLELELVAGDRDLPATFANRTSLLWHRTSAHVTMEHYFMSHVPRFSHSTIGVPLVIRGLPFCGASHLPSVLCA